MKAVTFEGADKALVVSDIPMPQPGPGQLLLKVAACGICGSDLHAYQASVASEGIAFGHEFSGEVAALGEGVTGWKVGDRATSMGFMFCGQCPHCLEGLYEECEAPDLIGFTRHGAYSEYVTVQAAVSTPLPAAVDNQQAALVEPLAVGLAAFRDCQLPMGSNVLIIGAGIIGIAVLKWARFFGAENVVISDLDEARLARAKLAGATDIINAGENPDPVQAFKDITGLVPTVIVECVGRPMLQRLIDAAATGTHIVSVGASMEPEPITSLAAAQKKIRITFSFGYSLEDFKFIIRILESGRIRTDGLITRSVSLDEVPDAFADLMQPNGHCKIMIEP